MRAFALRCTLLAPAADAATSSAASGLTRTRLLELYTSKASTRRHAESLGVAGLSLMRG
jgi:hypothetical protein